MLQRETAFTEKCSPILMREWYVLFAKATIIAYLPSEKRLLLRKDWIAENQARGKSAIDKRFEEKLIRAAANQTGPQSPNPWTRIKHFFNH